MLELARMVTRLYYADEFENIVIYGTPRGIGKSSYTCKAFAEVIGRPHAPKEECIPDFEAVKRHVLFQPVDVVERCFEMVDKGKREEGFIWEDAGLWLNAMEWWDPFVISFSKYLNVARTNWGAILFTTPYPGWVIKKIRESEGVYTIKVIKAKDDRTHPKRPRFARCYRRWYSPDLRKTGVNFVFMDEFGAWMPNDFFEWYKPLRDQFAKVAVELMRETMGKRLGKHEKQKVAVDDVEKSVRKSLPEPERVMEMAEIE